MTSCTRYIPRQSSHRTPRANRRGLGLLDVLLAVVVLSVIGVMGWQAAEGWIDRKLLTSEGRALATLARAGRLWVEADTSTRAPAPDTLTPVGFNDLVVANLRGPGDPDRTPTRRKRELWLWREANDHVVVLARARPRDSDPDDTDCDSGEAVRIFCLPPAAIDGVPGLGLVVDPDSARLRLVGPDVTLDLERLNRERSGFAQEGDLFALTHVFVSGDCGPYLSREDPACATMKTDLDMGENNINDINTLTAKDIQAESVTTDQINANTGDFSTLAVDDLAVGKCDGCGETQ